MSTTVITIVTPDTEAAVDSRMDPQANAPQMSLDRIGAYFTAMANGSQNKTSVTVEIGALPPVVL